MQPRMRTANAQYPRYAGSSASSSSSRYSVSTVSSYAMSPLASEASAVDYARDEEVTDVDAKAILASQQHSHALIEEHHRTRPDAANIEPIVARDGVRIYELKPVRFNSATGVKPSDKRRQMKRYIAHFQVQATLDEVTTLLVPPDHHTTGKASTVKHARSVLSPEVTHSSLLWRPSAAATALSGSAAIRQQSWTGIQWVVHKMPTMLTRDRDFVLLEHHHAFVSKAYKRGYVHLQHSTDAPQFDPAVAHGSKRVTRGTLYQSGVVALESAASTGLVDVSVVIEADFFGTYSPSQHRQVVLKRLTQWAELKQLVWKRRMAESGQLILATSLRVAQGLSASGVPTAPDCDLCKQRAVAEGRPMGMQPPSVTTCQCCHRHVCLMCTQRTTFPAFLVDVAMESALARQHPSKKAMIAALSEAALRRAKDNEAAIAAVLCGVCIHQFSKVDGSESGRSTASSSLASTARSS